MNIVIWNERMWTVDGGSLIMEMFKQCECKQRYERKETERHEKLTKMKSTYIGTWNWYNMVYLAPQQFYAWKDIN